MRQSRRDDLSIDLRCSPNRVAPSERPLFETLPERGSSDGATKPCGIGAIDR